MAAAKKPTLLDRIIKRNTAEPDNNYLGGPNPYIPESPPNIVPVPGHPGRVFIPALNQFIQQNQEGPGEIYDTVLIALPPKSPHDEYTFFRDIVGKGENLTNCYQVTRIRSYDKLKVSKVTVEVFRWSGDDMVDVLWLLGVLKLQINNREPFAWGPLRQFKDDPKVYDLNLSDTDDINVKLALDPVPWEEATTSDYRTKQVITDLSLDWPKKMVEDADYHGYKLPAVKQTRTEWELYTRPMKATIAVKVSLQGTLLTPLGR